MPPWRDISFLSSSSAVAIIGPCCWARVMLLVSALTTLKPAHVQLVIIENQQQHAQPGKQVGHTGRIQGQVWADRIPVADAASAC